MNRRRFWVFGLGLIASLFGFFDTNRNIFAQNTGAQEVQNIFLPAPRDLIQRLSRARKAIAEERFSDAVSELGKIQLELDEQARTRRESNMESQDYFMGPRGEGGTFTSLKTEAQRLLGSMPAKGREWYELQFGSASRALLDEAVEKGDPQKLADASRLYFHTKAGYEATMLLGRYHMDHGRPLAAALCFKRVSETPAAAKYEPELSLMLSTCWLYANMPEKVESAMLPLEKQTSRFLRIGAKEVELPAPGHKALEWIEKLVGKPMIAQSAEQHQWVMFRGNATRTGTSAGGLPLANARWRVPTVNNPSDEELVKQLHKKFAASGTAVVSTIHPLVVDDVVMMRTPERLIAVDFRTGKRVWVYPWDDAATEDAIPASRGGQGAYSNRLSELQQRLWEDSPYGQLSSDGNFLFLIDDLGYVSPNANMPFVVMARGGFAPNRGHQKSYNQLVALEIKTQGKIQWKVGDADGQDEPKLAGAFFLGPPLPLQGQLYCLAEFNPGEIRLVVLNAKTGQLVWQQQLAILDNRPIQADSGRRLAGASPSFADGVLVCPTSAGAVIGVDVSNRTLLWGYQYSQSSAEPNGRMWRGMQQIPQKPFGQRWTDATITISDGRVLVTPPETDDLFCLDLLTGKLSWPTKKRDDNLYVGCVQDGKAFLVGKNKVTAINVADGKNAWDAPLELPKGALVSGRGFQRDGSYYLPTSNSQIVEIDLAKGQIIKSATLESQPGNLVCYRDEVLSQGVDNLSTFLVVEPLRKHVADLLKTNADDGAALARLGELQLHDGHRQESLATLRKAHRLRPDDDTIRTLLVKTLLTALRDDFALNRSVAGEIDSLIEQPTQRLEYLRLMASGLQKVGDVEGSFAAFLKLISASGSMGESQRNESVALEQMDTLYAVRRDRWTQGRLTDLYAAASPGQRSKMDELIAAQWDTTLNAKTVPALQRFVEYFGFHPLARRAGLELATKLIENEELLAAEMILAGLEKDADPTIAAGATYQLARLLAKGQQKELAAEYYRRLEENYASVDCGGGKLGKDCVLEDKAVIEQLGAKKHWAYGRVEVTEGGSPTSPRFQTHATVHPVQLLEANGPVIPSMNVLWDPQRSQSAVIRDGLGREVLSVSLARPDGKTQFIYYTASTHQARAQGHLLMMQVGAEVVAISLLKNKTKAGEAILWRDDLQQLTDNNEVPQVRNTSQPKLLPFGLNRAKLVDNNNGRPIGMLGPIRRGCVYYQRLKEVICVDPLTGEAIWTHGGIDFGAEIFGDDERLFVVVPGSREALVLSTVDGRELGRRPVPPTEGRLATFGRNVLSAAEVDQTYVLQLVDAWTGKELLSATYPKASKATLVGAEEFAVMQPDGTFEVLSLADGSPLIRTSLEGEPTLESIRVFRSLDRYLLLVTQPIREPSTDYNVLGLSGGAPSRIISGRVYAFDRKSGKSLWQSPAAIDQFAVAEDQPSEIPVLTFLRHLNPKSGRNANNNNMKTSVLCIDKRDGRALLQKDSVTGPTYVYEITGDPDRKSVTVALPTKTFTLRITDEPTAPEPPAQTGSFASITERSNAGSGGTFGSLFKTLGTAENVARAAAEAAAQVPGKIGNGAEKKEEKNKKAADDDPFGARPVKRPKNIEPNDDPFGEAPAKPQKIAPPPEDDLFSDPPAKPEKNAAPKKDQKDVDPFAP